MADAAPLAASRRAAVAPARDRADPFDVAAFVLLAALAVFVLAAFRDYAITNDEWVQHRYGELILAYYRSGLADRALFHYENLYLYGGLFDVVAVLLGRVVPLDVFDLRHLLSAVIGVAGIGASMASARLIAGPRAGFLAGLMLATCGFWSGAVFHHTKDVPFAAAMAGGLYFLLRAMRAAPRPGLGDVIAFGLFTGAALGLRVLGLLLLCTLGFAIALEAARAARRTQTFWRAAAATALAMTARFAPGLALAYAVMALAWPWSVLAPLNPLRGLFAFGDFHYGIRSVIAGQVYVMAEAPRWYIPAYLLIKTPLVMLAGVAASAAMLTPRAAVAVSLEADARRDAAIVGFAALFPILCEVAVQGPAFNGLRHFQFVLPPFAVLAGVGLELALRLARRQAKAAAAAVFAAIAAVAGWNTATLYRLHPYQYLDYNALVGGVAGASRNYAGDYWFTAMPEAVRGLSAYLVRTDPPEAQGRVYTVSLCGERASFLKIAPPNLQWAQVWETADFFVAPTHMNCDRDIDAKIVVTVERLGVPIAYVKDQRARTRPGESPPR